MYNTRMLIDLLYKVMEFADSYFESATIGNYKIFKENDIIKICAGTNKGILDYYYSLAITDKIINSGDNATVTSNTLLYRTGNVNFSNPDTGVVTEFENVNDDNLDELEFQYSTFLEDYEIFLFCSYIAYNFDKKIILYSSHIKNKEAMVDVWESIKDEQFTV